MFYVFLFCIVIANILKRHGTSFVFRSYADLFIYMYILCVYLFFPCYEDDGLHGDVKEHHLGIGVLRYVSHRLTYHL